MSTQQLRNKILALFRYAWDDKQKLQKIKDFLMEEIYEEEEKDKIEIPEKYQKVINDIAEYVNCGLTCFFNPETLELEHATEDELMAMDDPEEFEMITGEVFKDMFKHRTWSKCITIEKPESHEEFQIMKDFTDQMDDARLQNQLVYALNNRKPFANFNHIIHNSQYREDWFAFKQQQLKQWVWNRIEYVFDK